MDNVHLFELINAGPGLGAVPLAFARGIAKWAAWTVPLGVGAAWSRADPGLRLEMLELGLSALFGALAAWIIGGLWPHARPDVLHLGVQHAVDLADDVWPCTAVMPLWCAALSALGLHRLAVWGFPLLALGLVVGWSRVFLGVNLPYDVLAALPAAAAVALAVRALRHRMLPRALHYHARLMQKWRGWQGRRRR